MVFFLPLKHAICPRRTGATEDASASVTLEVESVELLDVTVEVPEALFSPVAAV